MAFLTVSFVPTSEFSTIERKVDLPHDYYLYLEISAGDMDLIFWSFTSTGSPIEAYYMDSKSFSAYHLWPSELMLMSLGNKLSGYSFQASGQFKPPKQDVWYFIFINSADIEETASVEISIYNFAYFSVIIPLIIVVVCVIIVLGTIYYYYSKLKAKKKTEPEKTAVSWEKVQAPIPATQQVQQELGSKTYCPMCSTEIIEKNARFCINCKYEFKKQ